MALEKITEEELNFIDMWHTPQALCEMLFHNWDNLNAFDEKMCGELRLYQAPMLSDEAIIDFDLTAEKNHLSRQEIFDCRKRVGDIYNFGARKFGKSLVTIIMDLVVQMMMPEADKVALASADLIHIQQVLNPIKGIFQNHPICSQWTRRITSTPAYLFELKTDWKLESVNCNLGTKEPGRQWLGKHVSRVYIEEQSLETEEVYEKRKDALSELGAIFRCSGMTNFTPHSPAGKVYYNPQNKPWILNLPQFVNPTWNKNKQKKAAEEYGGEGSVGYRMFVLGVIIEDGITTFDMERIRKFAIDDKKTIKHFEISKDRYKYFKTFLIMERPNNSKRIFIDTDVGEHVSEINIISQVEDKYEYLYNVTLFGLTDDEQSRILLYLVHLLKANVIGIDCGDGMGRAIYREVNTIIPTDNLVWYDGKMRIIVGYELDNEGHVIFKEGNPLVKEERMAEWSIKCLKDVLYDGILKVPEDFKFISQFGQVIGIPSGNMILYKCTAVEGDHLFDSFKVFGISWWLKSDANKTPDISNNWSGGITVEIDPNK